MSRGIYSVDAGDGDRKIAISCAFAWNSCLDGSCLCLVSHAQVLENDHEY